MSEHFDTVVIGGGQAGLAMGYHLSRARRSFVILDENPRTGDSWRTRWDSLRLFTPARYDALPGSRYPAAPWSYPSREEFANYLSSYAQTFHLPVRNNRRVTRLSHNGNSFTIETDGQNLAADNVVVAPGWDRKPKVPAFADQLSPDIRQLTAGTYKGPRDLAAGPVLVVGAGNSGADVALELASTHKVYFSGRHPGQIPWPIDAVAARPLTLAVFFAFSHIVNLNTPAGRKARPHILAHSGPLVRVKDRDLVRAGVERVPRTEGAKDGRPQLADGRTLEITNVIWCTGFRPDLAWIDLPVTGPDGEPKQVRGVAKPQGLYFLGATFQQSLASSMVNGVGRDAAFIARHIAARAPRPANALGNAAATVRPEGSAAPQ
ncbi:NAD(P)/FAD-dependent oxidoreductase [Pseudarthrobacter sp. NIBRBAC000502770]|uniref:flavin-containing monooxygenase n=1 Tax=Pseudarthrobacter sp. NIBRBAC000502770 TaxID=2590785 RepID=UPI0011406A81|nr:NAD(P)-binding domain-containing protein [Pseudarthrobacter sp. NIBRBAC000502770]QDG89353.1 FAD-dependent oxidoreductase [Pseudarthrobacter sp. NIBRBAC000502770]